MATADYLAYTHRPFLWPAMARNIANRLTGKVPDLAGKTRQRAEATAWCREHVVTAAEALERLGFQPKVYDLEQLFPEIIASARVSTPFRCLWAGPAQPT
jgi:Holliday junction resolvasome RuvABC DNA-binding subunit